MDFLQVNGLTKKKDEALIVNNIDFQQEQFQHIAIAGETGSGKSTLLKMIAGLIQPDAGEVLFQGKKVYGPEEKLLPGHPAIGYLSQYFELRNNYKVIELLSMANKLPEEEANNIYDICRITHLLERRTDQLSGGEKQRIATARLLITSPKLLLLDEPYSNLDMGHKSILKSVIHDISEHLNTTCIMISHDPQDILSWADEIIVMKEGVIVQQDAPAIVYQQPASEYVAALFGKYNLIPATLFGYDINKRLLLRPEDVQISTAREGIPATVKKVSFFGSFYEVEVLAGITSLCIRTNEGNYSNGDDIFISHKDGQRWHL